jgi:hypothetical protein
MWGSWWARLTFGGVAATLPKLGNPANMGVCVACYSRDIAGALGLHRAARVQYLRPEIPAFCPSGEGDSDAAIFVLGMLTGAALSHNFNVVGSAPLAPCIVVIGLIVVCRTGILGREKLARAR